MENNNPIEFMRRTFFVPNEKDEMRHIKEAVQRFMINVTNEMNKDPKRNFIITELIETGSMAESSKVWPLWEEDVSPELEFDYLAVAGNSWPILLGYTQLDCCPGFSKVSKDAYTWLFPQDVNTDFSHNLYSAFVALCRPCCSPSTYETRDTENTKFTIKEVKCILSDNHKKHQHCAIENASGRLQFASYTTYERHTIRFEWTSTRKEIFTPYIGKNKQITQRVKPLKTIHIVVDFLFGFSIKGDKPICIVPKLCDLSNHSCWKISDCITEIDRINDSHRDTYMAIKLLFSLLFCPDSDDEFLSISSIASYRIKTAVISHMDKCSNEMFSCQAKILFDLYRCIEKGEINHWSRPYPLKIDCLDNKKTSALVFYIANLYIKWSGANEVEINLTPIEQLSTSKNKQVLESIFGTKLSDSINTICESTTDPIDCTFFNILKEIRDAALHLWKFDWA